MSEMDRRELLWFKLHRGWAPSAGVDLDKWLGDMREADERLCDLDDFPKRCPECKGDYCRACK